MERALAIGCTPSLGIFRGGIDADDEFDLVEHRIGQTNLQHDAHLVDSAFSDPRLADEHGVHAFVFRGLPLHGRTQVDGLAGRSSA